MRTDLIFDVGCHKGEDLDFYLKCGFQVVGVDASERFIAHCKERFRGSCFYSSLSLVNSLVGCEEAEALDFYHSKHEDWSSVHKKIADRHSTLLDVVQVRQTTLKSLFEKYGTPYYCKIDIEGEDLQALSGIGGSLPLYISCESECLGVSESVSESVSLAVLDKLKSLGYSYFQIVEQNSLRSVNYSQELSFSNSIDTSKFQGHSFGAGCSGLFGHLLPKSYWMSYEDAKNTIINFRRHWMSKGYASHTFWCDIHAKLGALGKPDISVVMPVYNAEDFVFDSINSVLCQTKGNFELIVVDDGSSDNTLDVIRSIKDSRISLICKEHTGISDSLNVGFAKASGKYIIRMDADDLISADKFSVQFKFMEENPDISVCGCGFKYFGMEGSKGGFSMSGEVTRELLLGGNRLCHASVIIRKESFDKVGLSYDSDFDGAEDYFMWFSCLAKGLRLYNIPDKFYYYRQHSSQVTCSTSESSKRMFETAEVVRKIFSSCDDPLLTCIIPFKNEGVEVEKTVLSIKRTAKNVQIILIDDASDDGYDYKSVASAFGCVYKRNEGSLGVAASRDLGVSLCKCPFFVLLDGHMRFYHPYWDVKLVEVLESNPKSIVSSNTLVITKDKNGVYFEEGSKGESSFGASGAIVNLFESGWEFTAKWRKSSGVYEDLIEVPCVLGAVYASSVDHWFDIRGLYGLRGYACDEPLMSIKSWLSGGSCLLMESWGVGHLYRGRPPYKVRDENTIYNSLFLALLFADLPLQESIFEGYKRRCPVAFKSALLLIDKDRKEIAAHRHLLETKVFKRDFSFFKALNDRLGGASFEKPVLG